MEIKNKFYIENITFETFKILNTQLKKNVYNVCELSSVDTDIAYHMQESGFELRTLHFSTFNYVSSSH